MIVTKKSIPRRTILRGLGAGVALAAARRAWCRPSRRRNAANRDDAAFSTIYVRQRRQHEDLDAGRRARPTR